VNNNMKRSFLYVGAYCFLLLLFTGCNRHDGNIRHGSMSYNTTDIFGSGTPEKALADAAAYGDMKTINRLIAAGANVNAAGRHEITPLWWAAWAENKKGFTALLDHGANPSMQRTEGYPIMYLVVEIRDPAFLEAALKHGGDANLIDKRTGEPPLFRAVMHDLCKHVKLLLAAGADANAQPLSGETLPATAIGVHRDYQLAYELIQAGADPTKKQIGDNTLADVIELASLNGSNNDDPWRAKLLELLESKGIKATGKYHK
jgi:ankyrin repeat protein